MQEITTKTIRCIHLEHVDILWIRNNPQEGPPVVFINHPGGPLVVTLTNQTFYVKCPACYRELGNLLQPNVCLNGRAS